MLFDERKSARIAQDLLKMKYRRGGRGPETVDCYGVLVCYYKQFGLALPDYFSRENWGDNEEIILSEYARFFRKLAAEEKPQTGDMIILRNMLGVEGHLGVYLGDRKFIHSFEKIGTKIDSLTNRLWKNKVYGFFRPKDTDTENVPQKHWGHKVGHGHK